MAPPPPPPPPPPRAAAAATLGSSGRAIPIPITSSCHHCHIRAPIPARDLKRTHPLRSSFTLAPRIENDFADSNNDGPLNFMKNVSFLYRKIHKNDAKIAAKQRRQAEAVTPSLPPTPPIPRHSTTTINNQPVVVLDSLPPLPPLRRRRPLGIAGIQAAVLIGAYALLLVLAVVIGVVLTQRPLREGRGRAGSPVPRRPVFQGASLDQGLVRSGRPRHPQVQENFRIGRPRQQSVPLPPPPPPPRPTPAPTTTDFPDYDYVYVDEAPQLLPNPVAAPRPPPFIPQVAPRRPAPQPAPRRPAPQPAPRRPVGSLASIDRDFNLEPEQKIRGLKEPDVKILKSWSHQNHDGTYTWGYVNTDGSFKNETRGLDCVVHGIYGYIDQDTGLEVSFPYQSGNPCDPDAPDYYYDYDSNVMMIKEANGDVFSRPGASRPNQQPIRRQG